MNETLEKIAYFLNDLCVEYYYDPEKEMLVLNGNTDLEKLKKLKEFKSSLDDKVFTHRGIFQIEMWIIK